LREVASVTYESCSPVRFAFTGTDHVVPPLSLELTRMLKAPL